MAGVSAGVKLTEDERKERRRAREREAYRKLTPEQRARRLAHQRKWRAAHPEKDREYYERIDLDKLNARRREDYANDPRKRAQRKAQAERYAARHKGRLREKARDHYKHAPAYYLLKSARKRARDKGLPFNLTVADIIIPDVCPVLGIPLIRHSGRPKDDSATLDRVNPALGYVRGNVAVISYRANVIKNMGTIDEHERIAAWMRAQVKG